MGRRIDFSTLTGAERIVLASGILSVLNGIVPWWYRIPTPEGRFAHNAGLSGWGVAAVVAGAAAAIAVIARAAIWPEPAPRRDGNAYTVLGLLAVAVVGLAITRTHVGWAGQWVGLGLAIVTTLGGLRRRAERRAGWT